MCKDLFTIESESRTMVSDFIFARNGISYILFHLLFNLSLLPVLIKIYSGMRKDVVNKMYQIAVCDDEPALCKTVSDMIKSWNQDISVSCFYSGEELVGTYNFYDAIFLDIDMNKETGGINGIETGRRIRRLDHETKIVYLTAYRDYVAGAFEVHAFQYLLKPVSEKLLHRTLEEIFRYVKKTDSRKIMDFHTSNGVVCVDTADICYFEFVDRKIKMVTVQDIYYMTGKISSIYERTCSLGFSMPHKSFVVNLFHVKNVKNLDIIMDNGEMLPLSQKKQKEWKQELANYLSQRLEYRRREGGGGL